MKANKCKICKSETENFFNIHLKKTPICEACADYIFTQQAKWLSDIVFKLTSKHSEIYNKIIGKL